MFVTFKDLLLSTLGIRNSEEVGVEKIDYIARDFCKPL